MTLVSIFLYIYKSELISVFRFYVFYVLTLNSKSCMIKWFRCYSILVSTIIFQSIKKIETRLSSKVTNIKFSEFINIKDSEFLKALHDNSLVEDICVFMNNVSWQQWVMHIKGSNESQEYVGWGFQNRGLSLGGKNINKSSLLLEVLN